MVGAVDDGAGEGGVEIEGADDVVVDQSGARRLLGGHEDGPGPAGQCTEVHGDGFGGGPVVQGARIAEIKRAVRAAPGIGALVQAQ